MNTKKTILLPALIKNNKNTLVRYGSLILVIALFGIVTRGEIFSAYNLKVLVGQTCALMIISAGMIFMFAHGSVDIASGSVAGLCSVLITYTLNSTGSMPLAAAISIAVSVALYFLSWLISTKFGLMSTIASLAVMFIARGAVTYISSLQAGRININDYNLISPFKNNIYIQLSVMVFAALGCLFLFNYTKLGKYTRAIGDNPLATRQSGADVNKTKLLCYLVAGACVGVAGVFILARAGNVSKNIGAGTEMSVMVAVILGGMNLSGGAKSRVSAAIVGSITFSLLSNGLTIAGVSQGYISFAKGVIFLVIIALTLRQGKNIKEIPR